MIMQRITILFEALEVGESYPDTEKLNFIWMGANVTGPNGETVYEADSSIDGTIEEKHITLKVEDFEEEFRYEMQLKELQEFTHLIEVIRLKFADTELIFHNNENGKEYDLKEFIQTFRKDNDYYYLSDVTGQVEKL